ncbi:hypothetical protein D6851_11580 [Altericroceibacterium spongiae]|uniref:Uncharacterized protein n=1 Tax=Altericroceibacterium spongiae TaxID=2320269 RepID=A0A420EJB5_9SPHN|nr:hypothetical protein D6851_11580 [Altericroceibacterium spongiae]
MDGTFRGIEHQSAMRSLYVLSSLRSRAVGNRELDSGAAGQAKSDIGRCACRDPRRPIALQRRLCRLWREACRHMREHDRNSRESSKEADSFLPLCSLNVLFVFLQASFAVSR